MELPYHTFMPVTELLETTPTEYFHPALQRTSITLSWLLDMALRMESTSGWSRTPGVQTGEMLAKLKSGINFIISLLKAFISTDPKSAKKTDSLTVFLGFWDLHM
jgi:hypothetical protein